MADAASHAPQPTHQTGPQGDSLMTADDVAQLLGVPASWVYEQSRLGRIPTITLGRYRRYRAEAIEAWIEDLEAGGDRPLGTARHISSKPRGA